MRKVKYIILILLFASASYGQNWSSIGSFGWVYALTVYNGELIAGGPGGIGKWNGSSWTNLGTGIVGEVDALCVYNGNLYAGGSFYDAGGVAVSNIAMWNGSAWSDPEGGTNSIVAALTVYNSKLIVGGYFTDANGPANYIASWDGSNWAPLGSGMGGTQGQVKALTVYNGELIAAGFFSTAGGSPASRIAKWNGSTWSALGSGIDNVVYALTVYNGNLIAGGLFNTAGGQPANDIAKWNGSSWSSFGNYNYTGLYPYIMGLAVQGNDLYAGGLYTYMNGVAYNGIGKWNGTSWSQLSTGFWSGSNVCGAFALTIYNNNLIAGGIFGSAGGVSAGNIASWSTLTGAENNLSSLPSKFRLSQNYPNPFNPSTSISFEIPKASNVNIKVFDIKGTEVATLVNENRQAGSYKIDFNASKLGSGTYFYKMNAGDFSETKKMLLIK